MTTVTDLTRLISKHVFIVQSLIVHEGVYGAYNAQETSVFSNVTRYNSIFGNIPLAISYLYSLPLFIFLFFPRNK